MLYWNTVSPLLESILRDLMQQPAFSCFRLVGGTALSLHLGHRMSVDIDLFTDAQYDSVDFAVLEAYLSATYPYFSKSAHGLVGMGCSYLVGKAEDDSVKVDVYYTDDFIQPAHTEDGIRLATVDEIAAMKMDVVDRGGRKKDFWDLDELLDSYTLDKLLSLHAQRYPFTHDEQWLLQQLVQFDRADNDFTPICLRGKIWELIKYGMVQRVDGRQ